MDEKGIEQQNFYTGTLHNATPRMAEQTALAVVCHLQIDLSSELNSEYPPASLGQFIHLRFIEMRLARTRALCSSARISNRTFLFVHKKMIF